jgi:hypothetical protein
VLLLPGVPVDGLLGRIVGAGTREQLEAAVANEPYDYAPVDDQRPYFFNILRPSEMFRAGAAQTAVGVVAEGNLQATRSLVALWVISALLVAATIVGPLVRAGRPSLDTVSFACALAYFSAIGLGFMLVQIPLMQRFSVYLGHPTYSVAVILFSMILAAGVGSFLSDRVAVEERRGWLVLGPLWIAGTLLVLTRVIQPLIDGTIEAGLLARCAIVVAIVGAAALPMGFCFPIGLRLVRRLAEDAMPWMWGVNGAFGVLASVSAVAISMWSGIHTNLYLAAGAYALLVLPALRLWSDGRSRG